MEFSVAEIFIIAITGMTIISFLFFAFRAIKLYRDFSENISNIVLGSIIAGIGCGTIIGINAIIAYITYTSLKCEIAAFYLIIMILPGKSPEAGQVPGALPPDDHPNAASDICGRFMIKKS
jgi:uncharacterized oligopeptide transporter (OPT) family protein